MQDENYDPNMTARMGNAQAMLDPAHVLPAMFNNVDAWRSWRVTDTELLSG